MKDPQILSEYLATTDPRIYRGSWKLVYHMASATLKAECGHTFGGALWWFVDPILSILVYYVAFGVILKAGGNDFIAFLCVGTLSWRWFQGALIQGSGAILNAAPVMQRVYLHKSIFVAVDLCVDSFKFLTTLGPLLVFIWLLGEAPCLYWLALPPVIFVQFTLTSALVGILAAFAPFFPDLRNILMHLLQLMIFVSGVFFNVDAVHSRLQFLVLANPMTGLIQAYRDCLLYQRWPNHVYLSWLFVISLAGLLCARKLINFYDREYVKVC